MSPEELRQRVLKTYDDALGNPLLHRFASPDVFHQLKAEREYWTNADGEALLRLLAAWNATQ